LTNFLFFFNLIKSLPGMKKIKSISKSLWKKENKNTLMKTSIK
jgi:hypothetical protein